MTKNTSKNFKKTEIKCPICKRVTLDVYQETDIYKCDSCLTTFRTKSRILVPVSKNGVPIK